MHQAKIISSAHSDHGMHALGAGMVRLQEQPAEQLVVPQNYTPVRAQACRVEPQGDPYSYVTLLTEAGPIGSDGSFKETSQAGAEAAWTTCIELPAGCCLSFCFYLTTKSSTFQDW